MTSVIDLTEGVGPLQWSAGAPQPVVVATEGCTLLSFWHPDGSIQVAELVDCETFKFGFPNEDAQHGHPLWEAGLGYNGLFEVQGSPWLDELRDIEAHHPDAPDEPFPHARHLVLAFHDSMLEAIASDLIAIGAHSTLDSALEAMTQRVGSELAP